MKKSSSTNRSKTKKAGTGRFSLLSADKLRGGYYTSKEVADWLCKWAIKKPTDSVLEPSCGDGIFLEAAIERLQLLGIRPKSKINKQITGIEINSEEAAKARRRVLAVGNGAKGLVKKSDFFAWWLKNTDKKFDAVVGNPPFIRYQSFPEPHRTKAMEIIASMGLKPNKLTNIWVPFVVAAATSIRVGGRLALVLPAELLQVTYAAQLRTFLTERFKRIDIIACNELFFKNAEQEVVLLLADEALEFPSVKNVCVVALSEMKTTADITTTSPEHLIAKAVPKTVSHDNEKWLKYFLSPREISFMRELRNSDVVTSLSTHASVDVGVVTGKNEFFVLTGDQVAEFGLGKFTTRLVSRSAHLKGAKIGRGEWTSLAANGDRVYLLHLAPHNKAKLPKKLIEYLTFGEARDVHLGFKCSVRKPWYAVPSVWIPDGFLFRQIYDFPRIVLNKAEATSTDTIHRLSCKSEKPERVIANTYTWLTAASAEIEGRSYGGGVLELEPTEAERLLMPAKLNGALPLEESDKMTRAGQINSVLEENARIVLKKHMGLSQADCLMLSDIWVKMRDRRMARRQRVG